MGRQLAKLVHRSILTCERGSWQAAPRVYCNHVVASTRRWPNFGVPLLLLREYCGPEHAQFDRR